MRPATEAGDWRLHSPGFGRRTGRMRAWIIEGVVQGDERRRSEGALSWSTLRARGTRF